jgi:hypothetical protein
MNRIDLDSASANYPLFRSAADMFCRRKATGSSVGTGGVVATNAQTVCFRYF